MEDKLCRGLDKGKKGKMCANSNELSSNPQ